MTNKAMGSIRGGWLAAALFGATLAGSQAAPAVEPHKAPPPPAAGADPKAAAKPGDIPAKDAKGTTAAASASFAAPGPTVEELYPTNGLRDPFAPLPGGGGGGGGASKVEGKPAGASSLPMVPPEEFSIHDLDLKGVMQDRTGGFAILVNAKYGASFVLKRGRLYDVKNKPVRGVTGTVNAKQKTVLLVGQDRDQAVLTMSEHGDDKDKKGEAADAQEKR